MTCEIKFLINFHFPQFKMFTIEHQTIYDVILPLENENKKQAKMIAKLENIIVATILIFSFLLYYTYQYNNKQILNIINDFNISKKELLQMITDNEAKIKKQLNNDQLKHIDQSTINTNLFQNFIPKTSNWKEINSKHIFLSTNNQTYDIHASSSAGNIHELKNLFNDHINTGNQIFCWRSEINENEPYIKIKFNTSVIANAISMTSRNSHSNEAPLFFGIFGVNENNQLISLGKFIEINWKNRETKLFPFENKEPYSTYIIKMYKSNTDTIGMDKLNLGFLLNN